MATRPPRQREGEPNRPHPESDRLRALRAREAPEAEKRLTNDHQGPPRVAEHRAHGAELVLALGASWDVHHKAATPDT